MDGCQCTSCMIEIIRVVQKRTSLWWLRVPGTGRGSVGVARGILSFHNRNYYYAFRCLHMSFVRGKASRNRSVYNYFKNKTYTTYLQPNSPEHPRSAGSPGLRGASWHGNLAPMRSVTRELEQNSYVIRNESPAIVFSLKHASYFESIK